jgi:stage V sporulation protein G
MNKVCAIASIVIDDEFVVHDLRIVNGDKGLFVAMPSRKLPNGEFRDVCHPLHTEARTELQSVVLEAFEAEGGLAAFRATESASDAEPHEV